MKCLALFFAFIVALSSAAQVATTGSTCGTVLDENGQPAKNVLLSAIYLGGMGGAIPASRSDDAGHYCFPHLPLGQNMVSADDPKRGYPGMHWGFYSAKLHREYLENVVILSRERPNATVDFRIPYKAAFLSIHLQNAATGVSLSGLSFDLRAQSDPEHRYIDGSQGAADPLLIPPNENILAKISAPGYREWPYDGSPGYILNLLPGEHKTIEVALQAK